MKIEFELSVRIQGDSLEQIDNGLIEAATQRLMARIQNAPKITTQNKALEAPKSQDVDKPGLAPVQSIPPGVTAKPAPKPDPSQKGSPSQRAHWQKMRDQAQAKREQKLKEKQEAESREQKAEQEDPAVRALRAVHSKMGEGGAREVLSRFGVSRCRELAEDQKEAFVQACNSILEPKLEIPNGN